MIIIKTVFFSTLLLLMNFNIALANGYDQQFFKLIRSGNTIEVSKSIAAGMDVNQKDYKGTTPLMRAASFGYAEIVKLLIENKAEISARDNEGNTPLKHASWSNEVKILDMLIENGADVEAKNKLGTTPIWSAVITGRVNMVKRLLKHGANPNVANQYGMSPVRFAKSRDDWELVKLLQAVDAKEF